MFVWSVIIYKHRCVYNEKIKTGRECRKEQFRMSSLGISKIETHG